MAPAESDPIRGEPERADLVQAAGGVVWRRRRAAGTADGATRVEVLLVHRPGYDDWSLPKGKAEPGESLEETALREVQEETGLDVEIGPEVATVTYTDQRGRLKCVRYWAMRPVGPEEPGRPFVPNREIDDIRWAPLDEARLHLTYDTDRQVLEALRSVLPTL